MYSKLTLFCVFLLAFSACEKTASTKSLKLSTISSTDTLKAGTPAGMHMYLNKDHAFNLTELLQSQGYSLEKLKEVKVNQIRIVVEIPEINFDPSSIVSFNTSFTKKGSENTVIESNEISYIQRTYIIDVRDGVSSFKDFENDFDLSGGLKLREDLKFDIVLTTQVLLEADVLN